MYKNNSIKLTPLYDTVCTLAYPNLTNKLSMKIGKHVEIKKVNKEDLAILAKQIGLKAKAVCDTYFEIFESVSNAFEKIKDDPALKNYGNLIKNIEQIISKRKLS